MRSPPPWPRSPASRTRSPTWEAVISMAERGEIARLAAGRGRDRGAGGADRAVADRGGIHPASLRPGRPAVSAGRGLPDPGAGGQGRGTGRGVRVVDDAQPAALRRQPVGDLLPDRPCDERSARHDPADLRLGRQGVRDRRRLAHPAAGGRTTRKEQRHDQPSRRRGKAGSTSEPGLARSARAVGAQAHAAPACRTGYRNGPAVTGRAVHRGHGRPGPGR